MTAARRAAGAASPPGGAARPSGRPSIFDTFRRRSAQARAHPGATRDSSCFLGSASVRSGSPRRRP